MLTDLTLIKANGPKCSYASNNSVEYTHHFKVDRGVSGNLLPLCLYKKIFPNVTRNELEWSIDHRVQLLTYSNKVIKQLGECYLHVKNSKGHTKLCKFFIVNSKFNPVNCALRLGLIAFNTPIYQDWSDSMPIDSVDKHESEHNTNTACITGALSGDVPLKANGKHNFAQMPETITKDWITNHSKYKHLFQGIGHFKCKPVTIELQSDAEPVRKAPCKVPLPLKDKFTAEIQSMAQQGILSEVTQSMETPEWLNSFIIVKKPNGNLRVCLDPPDLNKHIIRPVCNMYTLEDIVDKLKVATHFTIFDPTKSFIHVPLDDASKKLTAMLTPIGIFVYNVLAMALSNTTGIFEKCMREIIKDMNGVINIADDVLVFGVGKEDFQNNVISFLDHCIERDLHLNPDKIQIDVLSVPFFGQTLTKQELKMDHKKWEVIQQ